MKSPKKKRRHWGFTARGPLEQEQRKDERRKCECQGYCYIEMVGWMDRREKERRKDLQYKG
jgi:hypothetical protein